MVSIILCTYNRAHTLKATIDSILRQTYRDFEFIIVDDGSTDQTQQVLEEYSDERIRSFIMEQNSFYCVAANYGMEQAKGEYIAFATSDDIWEPAKLEKQIRYLENKKTCGACFTFVHMIDEKGEDANDKFKDMLSVFQTTYYTQKDWIQRFIFQGNCLCHPTAVVRREVLEKVGGYHVYYSLLADMELWLRIVRQVPIHVIEEDLLGYRMYEKEADQISGASEKKITKSLNEHMMIRKSFINDLSDQEMEDFFADRFRYKEACSHQEMEIEKAFLLMNCVSDLPQLYILGMEKLETLLQNPEYIMILRDIYHIRLQDIYQWNTEHFYMDYGMHTALGVRDQQIQRLSVDVQALSQHARELDRQRAMLYEERDKLRELADVQKLEIEQLKSTMSEKSQHLTLKEKECKELRGKNKKTTELLNRALLEKLKLQERKR